MVPVSQTGQTSHQSGAGPLNSLITIQLYKYLIVDGEFILIHQEHSMTTCYMFVPAFLVSISQYSHFF